MHDKWKSYTEVPVRHIRVGDVINAYGWDMRVEWIGTNGERVVLAGFLTNESNTPYSVACGTSETFGMQPKVQQVFVGYDDISDWVWDMLPPGEETDYNSTLISEQIIDTWPALIGWHEEIAKGAAIDALVSEEAFRGIAAQHKADI